MAHFKLYGPALSTYVRTVRMILIETETPYELEAVDIFSQRSSGYLAKHPFGKVPVLEVDGVPLYETCAIVEYLDAVVGQHRFMPSDPWQAARVRQIMSIIDSYLYSPAIRTITIQRLIVAGQGGQPDENAIEAAVPRVKTALEAIDALATGSDYLIGDRMTLADFYLLPVMFYLSKTPELAAVISDAPRLQAWWRALSQRPSFLQVTA